MGEIAGVRENDNIYLFLWSKNISTIFSNFYIKTLEVTPLFFGCKLNI